MTVSKHHLAWTKNLACLYIPKLYLEMTARNYSSSSWYIPTAWEFDFPNPLVDCRQPIKLTITKADNRSECETRGPNIPERLRWRMAYYVFVVNEPRQRPRSILPRAREWLMRHVLPAWLPYILGLKIEPLMNNKYAHYCSPSGAWPIRAPERNVI
jgi:hypothetical protein